MQATHGAHSAGDHLLLCARWHASLGPPQPSSPRPIDLADPGSGPVLQPAKPRNPPPQSHENPGELVGQPGTQPLAAARLYPPQWRRTWQSL